MPVDNLCWFGFKNSNNFNNILGNYLFLEYFFLDSKLYMIKILQKQTNIMHDIDKCLKNPFKLPEQFS